VRGREGWGGEVRRWFTFTRDETGEKGEAVHYLI
jgi:hypothetical protein